jgi:circadian clock protein KaiC
MMAMEKTRAPSVQIPKTATGISGLDEVLQGGLPLQRTTLIKGTAGSGKTVLGLEVMYRSALAGEPVIMVCFEESAAILRQNALAMGWDIAPLEQAGTFFLWEAKIDQPTVVSGDFNIDSLLAVIGGKARQMGARRIMIDAIDVLMRIFEDPIRERNEMYRLHDWLLEQQFTTILTAKDSIHSRHYDFLDYLADCVLFLDMRVIKQVTTRRLRVIKYRGSGFCSNEYPYLISDCGSVIMPITAMELQHAATRERVSSGNSELDALLGGGLQQGSGILICGPTGCGKTTLAATFAQQACAQGKQVLYVSFEESQQAVVNSMLSPGIDLRPAVKKGLLQFHTIMPEAVTPEEHLYMVLCHIEAFSPNHLIIDAISACERMASEQMAFDFLVRLLHLCKQRNITCLMTNQLESNEQLTNISGIGISSIIDTLMMLRYVELEGHIRRDLVIIKSRGTHHSNRHHLYTITDDGIRIDSANTEKE